MSTSIFRNNSRSIKTDEDVLAATQFARNVLQQKQATQLSGSIGDLGNKVNAVATMTLETITPPNPTQDQQRRKINPNPEDFLPSEVIQVCYNGRPAEFRMYGGFIRYLDGQ